MRLFDTHCHLNDEAYQEDFTEVMARAQAAGVEELLVVGYDLASSEAAIKLAEENHGLYAAVGFHPHEAAKVSDDDLSRLEELLTYKKVVALGEIGLDYYYDNSPRETQRQLFAQQLAIAENMNKPVIIHAREAHADILQVLKEAGKNRRGVMHCYSGSVELAREYLNLNMYIAIGGPVTFTNAKKLPEVVKKIPAGRLLIETDSPYLTPHPLRGRRNEPAYLVRTALRISEILEVNPEEIADLTRTNAYACFEISPRPHIGNDG